MILRFRAMILRKLAMFGGFLVIASLA